jgi:hypothetical protein
MKKTLIITLITGRVIERDLTLANTGAPVGAPANDSTYAQICLSVCVNGYTDPDLTTEAQYTHIAPSQIQSVTIKLDK